MQLAETSEDSPMYTSTLGPTNISVNIRTSLDPVQDPDEMLKFKFKFKKNSWKTHAYTAMVYQVSVHFWIYQHIQIHHIRHWKIWMWVDRSPQAHTAPTMMHNLIVFSTGSMRPSFSNQGHHQGKWNRSTVGTTVNDCHNPWNSGETQPVQHPLCRYLIDKTIFNAMFI